MNSQKDPAEDKWKAMRSGIKQRWTKLSEGDLDNSQGKKERIVQLLEKKYGYSGEEAKKEYEDFLAEEEARRKLPSDLIPDPESVHD